MRQWEKDMICELDDIALGIWRAPKTKGKMFAATDSAGIKAMFENW